MTLREKYRVMLEDLLTERKEALPGSFWAMRLDQQIDNLKSSIAEKFPGEETCEKEKDCV